MSNCDGYRPTVLRGAIEINRIFTVHYFEYTRNFAFSGESHGFWELCYVDNGAVEVTAGDKHHTLFTGDAIFHEPGEFHSLRADGRTAPNLVVFSFDSNSPAMDWFVRKIVRVTDRERSLMGRIIYETKQGFSTPVEVPFGDGLDRRERQPFGCEQIIRIYLEELLITLVRRESEPFVQGRGAETLNAGTVERAFGRVVSYFMDHLKESISVDDICRTTGYSPSYIQKIVKSRTGRGVAEYGKRLKLEAAKQMIRDGQRNFSEIAAALNYTSLQYFSKVFKHYIGMTPSQYASSAKLNSEFVDNAAEFVPPGPLGIMQSR